MLAVVSFVEFSWVEPWLPALLLSAVFLGAVRRPGRWKVGRSPVIARNGMVAASQPLAAQAGLQILRQGGNAIDAAVATAAALAVVEPMMTGPGGDMFALISIAETGELVGLNGSGFSPQAADIEFFRDRGLTEIPMSGPFSVTVPGAVDGWAVLLDKYGSLPLSEVLAPAIEYGEQGFPVSQIIAADWAANGEPLGEDPEFAAAYLVGGRAPAHGDVFVNKPLAKTFRQIAAGGRDGFYRGEIAAKIVARLSALGWPVTLEDLARQRSDWVEPIRTSYKGYEVVELPPNGQGMAALEMLNIAEGIDLASLGHNSSPYLHHLIEAKKLAYADLDAWLADPERADLPVARIISKEYGREQRQRIDPHRAAPNVASGIAEPVRFRSRLGDTVYLTVVDQERNVVSFINSLFFPFGSGVVVPDTGILLQSRGALFSLYPGHPNSMEGRKRPFHTIIPALVRKNGKPWMAFGVMGGDMQPQGHLQVLLNRIDFGMNVQEAGEAPRFRHLAGTDIALEPEIERGVHGELLRAGHTIVEQPVSFGGYQAIEIDSKRGVLLGGSDPRKDGCVAAW